MRVYLLVVIVSVFFVVVVVVDCVTNHVKWRHFRLVYLIFRRNLLHALCMNWCVCIYLLFLCWNSLIVQKLRTHVIVPKVNSHPSHHKWKIHSKRTHTLFFFFLFSISFIRTTLLWTCIIHFLRTICAVHELWLLSVASLIHFTNSELLSRNLLISWFNQRNQYPDFVSQLQWCE